MQAELGDSGLSQIGSISSISELGEPIIGQLAAASTGELGKTRPFSRVAYQLTSHGNAATNNTTIRLGAFAFLGIVTTTDLLEIPS
ncbi:hypothetical protein SAMD00023353_4300850 [Rosellinia necatrix]|uniref:Uncharacterized protein n=1 Tax=Rosellinia necatrix TaxID=77044 RepID=A0A1S8AAF3_ROSNE|nr:hypothetical protein SAMD00023353_4300850 [Rosellinia necatrix]